MSKWEEVSLPIVLTFQPKDFSHKLEKMEIQLETSSHSDIYRLYASHVCMYQRQKNSMLLGVSRQETKVSSCKYEYLWKKKVELLGHTLQVRLGCFRNMVFAMVWYVVMANLTTET